MLKRLPEPLCLKATHLTGEGIGEDCRIEGICLLLVIAATTLFGLDGVLLLVGRKGNIFVAF